MEHIPRVLIADRHPILRAGIQVSLEEAGFQTIGDVAELASAVAAAMDTHPDVCVLGASLHSPLRAAVRALRHAAPDTAVVVLSEAPDHNEMLEAVRGGASGYLTKDLDLGQLPRALAAVLFGEAAIPRRLVSGLLDEVRADAEPRIPHPRFPELTRREQEVLEMLSEGWSTARIAEHLFVAPVTVRTHVSAILGKLDLPNRSALVQLQS